MNPITQSIVALRGPKNRVDPWRAYARLHEVEPDAKGQLQSFSTIFLSNRECSFHCSMCDLWKNTTDITVPPGAIAAQIEHALGELPPAENVKLYNSGSFFDAQAIPPQEYPAISKLLHGYRRVVVENHPLLTDDRCHEFAKRLPARLEVAMGLETIHPNILPQLNKQMCLADFDRAVDYLLRHDIDVRAFVLLKPPGLDEQAGVEWAIRSVAHAVRLGVQCCSIIPVRPGNGYIDQMIASGEYCEPKLRSLEVAFGESLKLAKSARIFVDLWDIRRFSHCLACETPRIERLHAMNLSQRALPEIACEQCSCQ